MDEQQVDEQQVDEQQEDEQQVDGDKVEPVWITQFIQRLSETMKPLYALTNP